MSKFSKFMYEHQKLERLMMAVLAGFICYCHINIGYLDGQYDLAKKLAKESA